MIGHPVIVALKWPEAVDEFATNHVSKEDRCFFDVGNCEPNVVGSPKRGYSFSHFAPNILFGYIMPYKSQFYKYFANHLIGLDTFGYS